ncbi:MAG: transposase, partial [bacterium]
HNQQVVRYKGDLPDDARHKGYRSVVIQGIKIEPYNTEYRLERFYSKSTGNLYEANLPEHLSDGYDPSLKSWILTWYYDYRITEDKTEQKLKDIGIKISAGHISNILIKDKDKFHQGKSKIIEAGISSTSYQHIDDTGARVMGTSQYFSVLCNEYYSAFFINPQKSRLTVLGILSQAKELHYTINEATMKYLKQKNVPEHIRRAIAGAVWSSGMSKKEFINKLEQVYRKIKTRYRDIILEASAVAWYQEQNLSEKIKILL